MNQEERSTFDLVHALEVADHFEPGSLAWMTALFHDAVEDGAITVEELGGYRMPWAVALTVDALTRRPSETYTEYIERIADNKLAACVKQADLEVNLIRMDPEHESLRSRYVKALNRLDGAVGRIT